MDKIILVAFKVPTLIYDALYPNGIGEYHPVMVDSDNAQSLLEQSLYISNTQSKRNTATKLKVVSLTEDQHFLEPH